MLVRIVKLHIDNKKSKEFEAFFNQNKSKIPHYAPLSALGAILLLKHAPESENH